jgi:LysM repeat protein
VKKAAELPASRGERFVSGLAWLLALALVAAAFYLGWQKAQAGQAAANPPGQSPGSGSPSSSILGTLGSLASPTEERLSATPEYRPGADPSALERRLSVHTIIPDRPNLQATTYVVESGDSVFGISQKFNIKPETLLWANYDQLNDNPDMLALGMELIVPPTDGVYHKWREGDTVAAVAREFETTVDQVVSWSGNDFDLSNPVKEPGEYVMVVGGKREFRSWIIPVIPRGKAGVLKSVYGAGACEGSYTGAFGTGGFVWPAANHKLSGNDFYPGHLGLDIAAGEGAAIYAADSGVVVFAGWANGGYGNMVMIDHGNGYQTLYAHMSSVRVRCGQSVTQGNSIGASGNTGNSFGAHLHFEVRYLGGFINPWHVLP